jgi:hypothetical protein
MMVKDTESGVEFPLGQKFWWVDAAEGASRTHKILLQHTCPPADPAC